MLAETIQFSGPEVALIFTILITIALIVFSVIVAGYVSASRAHKSDTARGVFWFVMILEGFCLPLSMQNGPGEMTAVVLFIMVTQGLLYTGRRNR